MAYIDLDTLHDQIAELVEEQLINKLTEGNSRDGLGIDPRAVPHQYWFNDDMFVVETEEVRLLDYYGGFEYIEAEYREIMGDYTVFNGEHDRVREVLDHLNDMEGEEDDESDDQ